MTNLNLYGIINTEVRKETNRKNKRSRLKVTERKSIMANTMKKSEVLANARESALSTLGLLDIPGVRQAQLVEPLMQGQRAVQLAEVCP